jgi:hypothetical protein
MVCNFKDFLQIRGCPPAPIHWFCKSIFCFVLLPLIGSCLMLRCRLHQRGAVNHENLHYFWKSNSLSKSQPGVTYAVVSSCTELTCKVLAIK